jgi:hypothetical protein
MTAVSRARANLRAGAGLLLIGILAAGAVEHAAIAAARSRAVVRRITWADATPLHQRLAAHGLTEAAFPEYLARTHEDNLSRVREGDLDHLVFYALQSTHFTRLPPIEPALSAKALVEAMPPPERGTFLTSGQAPDARVPADVRARLTALNAALDERSDDPRLAHFGTLVRSVFPPGIDRGTALAREYLRAMRFVYEKEFVAQRSARAADAVAALYRTRGLSTDTEVEAGFVVYNGLGVVKALDPERRIRRVLIVGPGLDLAPRTGMLEGAPPESYQPWAVMDALISLGLSTPADLEVVGADINPRVVDHLRRSAQQPPALTLISGIQENASVTFSPQYREYFAALGSAIGLPGGAAARTNGHLQRSVRVRPEVARALDGQLLDIVTERLDGPPFDIVVATNILPYFDDRELSLAMCNVAAMLAPGGFLLHNEPRPILGDVTEALGLRFEQSRQAAIASVREAPPLADSVWIHRKLR